MTDEVRYGDLLTGYGITAEGEEIGVSCIITPETGEEDKYRMGLMSLMLKDAGATTKSIRFEWWFHFRLEVPDGNQDLHSG